MALTEVPIRAAPPEQFRSVLGEDYSKLDEAVAKAGELLAGTAVWHVNSTARGGGVAEMLNSLLAYARGAGVDTRWVAIGGGPEFFRVTKRIHNHLHGAPGDGGELGEAERAIYETALAEHADELRSLIRAGDIVYLHDPQTAGLIEPIRSAGARVVWRCHVGLDHPNDLARGAWAFLERYVRQADAYVFSRRAFVWEGLEDARIWVVPPSIDAFSPKNQEMAPEAVGAILGCIGLAERCGDAAVFSRQDGTRSRVNRTADLDQDAPVPAAAPLAAQVSRWDRLKDPSGVLVAFAEHCMNESAHLLLAGPSVEGVSDDPEGAEVVAEIRAQRQALPAGLRARIHLASLPMEDTDENAAMVNAIQRRADVIVQKSRAEGFGLTVAEAMWKARPVVATRIGGIQDQIENGVSGVLIDDPDDLEATGAAIDALLADPTKAEAMGVAARERVREQFLGSRHLVQYMTLIEGLLAKG